MARKHVPARRPLHLESLENRLCCSSIPVAGSTIQPRLGHPAASEHSAQPAHSQCAGLHRPR